MYAWDFILEFLKLCLYECHDCGKDRDLPMHIKLISNFIQFVNYMMRGRVVYAREANCGIIEDFQERV